MHTAMKVSGLIELVEWVDKVVRECILYGYKVIVVLFFWRGKCEYHASLLNPAIEQRAYLNLGRSGV